MKRRSARKRKTSVLTYLWERSLLPSVMLVGLFLLFLVVIITMLIQHNRDVQWQHYKEKVEYRTELLQRELSQLREEQLSIIYSQSAREMIYMYDDIDWYKRYSLMKDLHQKLSELSKRSDLINHVYLCIPSLDKTISDLEASAALPRWARKYLDSSMQGWTSSDGQIVSTAGYYASYSESVPEAVILFRVNQDVLNREMVSVESGYDVDLHILAAEDAPMSDHTVLLTLEGLSISAKYTDDETGDEPFAKTILTVCILFVIISFGIELYSVWQWSRQIYQPMHRLLIEAFSQMETGNLQYRIQEMPDSPFHTLYSSYNHMMDEMQRYVDGNLKQQLLVNKANLKQLQSQISPHFMYNSYYILYRLIRKKDWDNSLLMAEYLGKFYHYITRNADDEKTLRDEMDHAKTYLAIQQFRFRETLEAEVAPLDDSIAEVYVPRLIMQPLLENAFQHARNSENAAVMVLRIRYEVRSERDFDILVENSGQITDETLNAISEKLRATGEDIETTALVNIHRRLKIYFGESSGLILGRSDLGGLQVRMRIVRKEDGT